MYEFLHHEGKFYGFHVSNDILDDLPFHRAPVLWSASLHLLHVLKSSLGNPITPLETHLTILHNSISPADTFSKFILSTVPKLAVERGVISEETLKTRFYRVETFARRLDLVPAQGASLLVHLLSYLQSLLIFKIPLKNPEVEINDERIDFSQLETNEILCRAEFWLNRGELVQALKYMNLLKGASRSVASQWMKEAKVLLETEQVAKILLAHAASFTFKYL